MEWAYCPLILALIWKKMWYLLYVGRSFLLSERLRLSYLVGNLQKFSLQKYYVWILLGVFVCDRACASLIMVWNKWLLSDLCKAISCILFGSHIGHELRIFYFSLMIWKAKQLVNCLIGFFALNCGSSKLQVLDRIFDFFVTSFVFVCFYMDFVP